MKKSRFILLLGIITATCLLPVGKADWSALKKSNTLVASSSTAVCYIGNTKFTTLDDALFYAEANNENDKIYVIPGLNADNEGLKINNDHKINEGDSLVLPIDGTTVLNEEGTNAGEFADKNEAANLKTRITLKAGKTLTINGTLEIGAVTGSKSGIMGQASGSYCELLMRDNSSLVVNEALNCYGFIKESAQNKSAISVNDGGKIETPVVFYDHVDGTTSAAISGNGVFPYKQFDMPQIRSKMVFNYGSSLIGRMHIYGTNIKHCTATANLIGTSSSFINMESDTNTATGEEKTKLIWHYSDASSSTTSAAFANHATNIEVYGTQSFGSISATIYMNIDSKDYYLPIPCGYNIVIGDNTENSATFTLPSTIKGVKFMPGSSLTCNSGAIVNFNSGALFYQSTESNDGKSSFAYPSSDSAICLNNGIMNINAGFEGKITTSSNKTSKATLAFGEKYAPITDSKEGTDTLAIYNNSNGDSENELSGASGKIASVGTSKFVESYFTKNAEGEGSLEYPSYAGTEYWEGESGGVLPDINNLVIKEKNKDGSYTGNEYCEEKNTNKLNSAAGESATYYLEAVITPINHKEAYDLTYFWKITSDSTKQIRENKNDSDYSVSVSMKISNSEHSAYTSYEKNYTFSSKKPDLSIQTDANSSTYLNVLFNIQVWATYKTNQNGSETKYIPYGIYNGRQYQKYVKFAIYANKSNAS